MSGIIAVTGATGFIGKNLLPALEVAGFTVRALTRRERNPRHPGVTWVRGDLASPESLTQLVDGAQAVVHLAGAVRGSSQGDFEEINVEGAARLAEAVRDAGVAERVLVVSTLAAREPELSWYSGSKRRGEERVRERLEGGPSVAVFRPTAVYGPGDREMRAVFRAMRLGLFPMLGGASARVSLIHVEDLVDAIVLWASSAEPLEGTYELHDGTPGGYTWPRIARTTGEVWGRRVRRIPVPSGAVSVLSALNLVVARVIRRAPMLTPGKVRELCHPDWRCDNTALTAALAWKPRVDLADALERGVAYEP
jgi:nucleoside-diphosphate-sugar epimerase